MKMSHEGNDFLREKQWEEQDEPVVTHSFEDHDRFTVTGEQVDLMRVADIIIQIKKGGYLSESEKIFLVQAVLEKYKNVDLAGIVYELEEGLQQVWNMGRFQ